ncbi:MAG: hypothetical protein US40_C0002G0138 [Candidatus Roizmanbacteria bacterium GW2011_GWC2_37_13]|uniref:Phage-Barnase-EndoU-ColicinE5/D-RelE like nuclease 3 domain-containing protein n=1 Tax=Candidatus Roizmanbacteria bacterium GW2011_GWC2_37_13 TaxID=1618486 RepID=A0A0G0IR27_9BACT|nr:MAG: hypothetical protein US38_C0013G0019 [Candidatus Roizmanbacteria bacterium GW2011_GWC1_37_12]KKQ26604.1 MAG: hypothetical protein US40_C0002G0138 [Candidatus Roizmanbacteria bacterium GW2011_GWC2_37_13]
MINVQYTKHLLSKIRLRTLSKKLIEGTVIKPDYIFFDNLHKTLIAVKKLKTRCFMVAYDKVDETYHLITCHQIKEKQIENRLKVRRWVRYD